MEITEMVLSSGCYSDFDSRSMLFRTWNVNLHSDGACRDCAIYTVACVSWEQIPIAGRTDGHPSSTAAATSLYSAELMMSGISG